MSLRCMTCGSKYEGNNKIFECKYCKGSIEPNNHLSDHYNEYANIIKKGSPNGI